MKIAVAVLILLVALFVVSIWMGSKKEDSGSSAAAPQPSWVQSLQTTFGGHETFVAAGEVSAPCFSGAAFQLPSARPCSGEIAAAKPSIRTLHLALAGPDPSKPGLLRPATITINSKDGSLAPMKVQLTLKNPDTKSIKVLSQGATFSIQCDAAPCRVALL